MVAVNIIAIFIPVFFVIGLFTVIALNIYFKYKTNTQMSEQVPLESLGEWYRIEAQAKVLRGRGAAIRWGGFFTGLGLGIFAAILISNQIEWDVLSNEKAYAFFFVAGFALFCAGVGMIGAYFLERRLNKNTKCE